MPTSSALKKNSVDHVVKLPTNSIDLYTRVAHCTNITNRLPQSKDST